MCEFSLAPCEWVWMSGQVLTKWCIIYNEVLVLKSGLYLMNCCFFLTGWGKLCRRGEFRWSSWWGGGSSMRRKFVIYVDATSSLSSFHQGVQESYPKQTRVSWFNQGVQESWPKQTRAFLFKYSLGSIRQSSRVKSPSRLIRSRRSSTKLSLQAFKNNCQHKLVRRIERGGSSSMPKFASDPRSISRERRGVFLDEQNVWYL